VWVWVERLGRNSLPAYLSKLIEATLHVERRRNGTKSFTTHLAPSAIYGQCEASECRHCNRRTDPYEQLKKMTLIFEGT
jgi:hypothetical protein